MRNPFSFWTEMDEDRKDRIIRMTGLVMAAFTVFTLLSSVSYLFTWKADQSLLGDPKMMNLDAPDSIVKFRLIRRDGSYVVQSRGAEKDSYYSKLLAYGRPDFKTIEQTLYPIYGTIGVTYRIH